MELYQKYYTSLLLLLTHFNIQIQEKNNDLRNIKTAYGCIVKNTCILIPVIQDLMLKKNEAKESELLNQLYLLLIHTISKILEIPESIYYYYHYYLFIIVSVLSPTIYNTISTSFLSKIFANPIDIKSSIFSSYLLLFLAYSRGDIGREILFSNDSIFSCLSTIDWNLLNVDKGYII